MRPVILSFLLAILVVEPAFAQHYQPPPNPLYQPLKSATERALTRARRLDNDKAYAAAIVEYDKVLAQQPQFARALAERAFVKESLGDYEGAMRDHDEVLRLAPDRANSWSHAGWIRALRNIELDEALAYSQKAVALEPGDDPVDTRGFVRFRRGEWKEALADYDAVLKAYPQTATTLYMRGVVKARMGDPAGGEVDLQRALKLNKEIGEFWTRRGVTP